MAKKQTTQTKTALIQICLRYWEVIFNNSEENGEREFISIPLTLPRGGGILVLGGNMQGKLAAT